MRDWRWQSLFRLPSTRLKRMTLETDKPNDRWTGEDGDNDGQAVSDGQPTSFEDVYSAMGPPGRYQYTQLAMLLTCNIPMVFLIFKYVFISIEPPFRCQSVNDTILLQSIPANQSSYFKSSYDQQCEIELLSNKSGNWEHFKSIDCPEGYEYEGGNDVSFKTEWGYVCGNAGVPELAQTVVAIGAFLGQIVFNIIGDKFGRWTALTASIILTSASDLTVAFVPDIYSMIAIRFMTGILAGGMLVCGFILPFELLVEKYRIFFVMISGIVWSSSVVLHAGIGYAFRNSGWRTFQMYSSIIGLIPLFFMYFVDESPGWLLGVGNNEKAEKIIRRACETNGVDFERVKGTFYKCSEMIRSKGVEQNIEKQRQKSDAVILLKNKKYQMIIFFCWFACITNELTTSGLYLTVSTLAGNMYLNSALLGAAGIPSYIASWMLLQYKGRRFTIIMFTVLAGISVLISPFVAKANIDKDAAQSLSLAFFLFGKFSISGAYNTLYMYIPEIFPTCVRATGMGISTTGAPAGGAIVPYLLPLSKVASWAPGVTLSTCCLLSAISFLKMPETRGRKLALTMNDENVDISDQENIMKVYSIGNEKSKT